jgi:hypothetical protein
MRITMNEGKEVELVTQEEFDKLHAEVTQLAKTVTDTLNLILVIQNQQREFISESKKGFEALAKFIEYQQAINRQAGY